MNIKFVRTRYIYDSYSDFWKLVELSGFTTCYVDEIDISAEDTTYITTPINGEYRPHIKNEKEKKPWNAKLIWWNLERTAPTVMDNIVLDDIIDYVNDIWVSDRYYATLNNKFKFVILGSHPDLRLYKDNLPKTYDYCHMSYVYGRRDFIHNTLAQSGLTSGPNGWGDKRDAVLRSSKLLVNVHQDNNLFAEPLRFAVCAAYSLPIFSETNTDPYPLVPGVDIIQVPYNCIPNEVITRYNSDLTHTAGCLYNKLCVQHTFRSSVEEALGLK